MLLKSVASEYWDIACFFKFAPYIVDILFCPFANTMNDSAFVIEVTEKNYQQAVIEQSFQTPVLVDFWASWCQPCQMLMPLLSSLAQQYGGKFILAKINTEEQQALAAQFGIRSIPTVKLFKNGQPVDEFAGALPESQIRAFLDKHIPRESDALVEQALAMTDSEQALELLQQAKAADGQNANIDLAMAQIHAQLGHSAQALELLQSLPAEQRSQAETKTLENQLLFASELEQAPSLETLQQRLEADEKDSEARYLLALRQIVNGNYEAALEQLLTLMRMDRQFKDDAARKTLIRVFDMLADDPLVPRYRSRMMSLIY